jgi:hypothetical protein
MCPCEFQSKNSGKTLRNEIGANLFNMHEVLINFNSLTPSYQVNYANGFMYKRHQDKFSIRVGFDYLEHAYKYNASDTTGYNNNKGKSFSKNFRAGLEKTLIFKKLQIFAAADLFVSQSRYNGISEGVNGIVAYAIPYSFNVFSFGISPALGIKYRFMRRFSVTAETSLSPMYYQTSKSDAYDSESNSAVLFNPLRALSFNYHF